MPSTLHETLVEMFRQRPALAADLLGGALGMPLRGDAQKRWSWPVYVATLRARVRCPVVLLVMCVDDATAAWSAAPIELGGPGSRVVPLVLGPDRIPVVTDTAQAGREPELAVLSALAHGPDPERRAVLDALVGALAAVDESHALLYSDLVVAALPAAAKRYLEALMISRTHEWQSDFARRYVSQGRAEGRGDAVLAVLEARDIEVPEDVRRRITGCSDIALLDTWVRRSATVDSAEDLFR